MGFFGFGGGSPEQGAAKGRSEDAIYRGEVSPLDTDPSKPIEFALSPEESEAAQRGLLEAKAAAGRTDSEPIEVSREHIFGEQAQTVQAGPMGAAYPANPGNQGSGEERIRFDLNPEPVREEPDGETVMPSVLGGF